MVELGSVAVLAVVVVVVVVAYATVAFEASSTPMAHVLTFALHSILIAPLPVLASFGRVRSVFETVLVSVAET